MVDGLSMILGVSSLLWIPRWSVPSTRTGKHGAMQTEWLWKQPTEERTYPELTARGGRARLIVFGVEVGCRWSAETRSFLSRLAHDRAVSKKEKNGTKLGSLQKVCQLSRTGVRVVAIIGVICGTILVACLAILRTEWVCFWYLL